MKKICILHGWSYSTEKWQDFLNLVSGAKFLTIPGLTEVITRPWDIKDYAEWLKKKLDNKKVILLGHSNGGRIALYFSYLYPQLVEKLILIDSAGIVHNDWVTLLKKLSFKTLVKTGKRITTSPTLKKLLYKLTKNHDYERATPIMKQTMLNLINFDLTDYLPTIKTPTLIIWGEKDQVTPVSDARLIAKNLVNSTLALIPEARHSPQFTHPDKTAKIISQFLNP